MSQCVGPPSQKTTWVKWSLYQVKLDRYSAPHGRGSCRLSYLGTLQRPAAEPAGRSAPKRIRTGVKELGRRRALPDLTAGSRAANVNTRCREISRRFQANRDVRWLFSRLALGDTRKFALQRGTRFAAWTSPGGFGS